MADDDKKINPWEMDWHAAPPAPPEPAKTGPEAKPWEMDWHPPPAAAPAEEVPKNYGFTKENILGSAQEGLLGLGRGAVEMGQDVLFPPGETELERLKYLGKKYIWDPAMEQKALAERPGQSTLEKAGHYGATALPMVGPWAAGLGEQAGTGDIGGALTKGATQYLAGRMAPRALGKVGEKITEPYRVYKRLAEMTGVREPPAAPAPRPSGGLPPVPKMTTADIANTLETEFNRPAPSEPARELPRMDIRRPTTPPTVESQFRVEPTGTMEDPRRLGLRGMGGVRVPEQRLLGGGTIPPIPETAPFEIKEEMGLRAAVSPGLPRIYIPKTMTDPAEISRYVGEKQELQRKGLSTLFEPEAKPPAAPPPTTLPTTGGPAKAGPPPATLDEILHKATGQPAMPEDPLKAKYPDPAERRFVRANGEGVVKATEDDPKARQAIHDLKNWEVREAAVNLGIDLGTRHVGARQGLGPEQVSRQALLDRMIREGHKPEDILRMAKPQAK